MKTQAVSKKVWTLLIATLFVFISSSDSFAVAPATEQTLPSTGNFQGVAGGGVTANINSCFTGATGALGGSGSSTANNPISAAINASTGKGKGAKGAGAASASGCGSDSVPDSSSLTCDSPQIQKNGVFDSGLLQQQIASLSDLDGKPPTDAGAKNASLSCELNQFNTVTSEMKCVQQQGQLLTQQIGSLSQVYQQNITQFQQGQQAFTQREGDRANQLMTIGQLLGGNKDSGTKGLLQEQSDLQKLVNTTMPQDIAAAQAQSKTVANERAVITENIQKHTMSLTGDCFQNQTKASFQCTPGGPDLSPEAYVACMYGKYSHVQGGVYVTGAAADANAQAAQNTLQGILTQMYNQTSLSWVAPTDAASSQAAGSRPDYGNDITDLVNNYVNQMSGMTVNGISVATFVTQQLQQCYASAQAEVATEQADPSSTVGQAEFQQTQTETALKATFDQKLETYTEKWTEAMGVLTSQNLPLNLTNCKSQDITYEGNCLTDVQSQITGLLNGNGAATNFTMTVPYQYPDTQIPTSALTCQGMNGCVLQLQSVQQAVTNAKQTLTTQQQTYEQQARQTTQQFTSQMAQILSQQSSNLRNQLTTINSTLQGLGVSTSISFPNVQSEQLAYDNTNSNGGQGIPKMPNSVLNLIGSAMNPPMMDLTDNSNNDASAMADGVNKVKASEAKVASVRSTWEGLFSTCGVQNINANFEQAVSQAITQCSDVCWEFAENGGPIQQVQGQNGPTLTYQVVGNSTATLQSLYKAVVQAARDSATSPSGSTDVDPNAGVGPDTNDGGSATPSTQAMNTEINTEAAQFNALLSTCAARLNTSSGQQSVTANAPTVSGGTGPSCDSLSSLGLGDDKSGTSTGHHHGGGSDAISAQ